MTCLFYLLIIGLMWPPAATAQSPTPDPRFGIVQTYDDFAAAAELGVGFTRVKLYWDIIQPHGPDDWQPANIPDPLIATDLAAGRQVIGLIVRTPAWARDLDHPANDPDQPTAEDVPDMAAWGQFVRRLSHHYQGRIDHWIIWNEPDVWDDDHPGSTWKGSVSDFVELHRTAYLNIKAVSPNAQVYLTGLTYFWDYESRRPQYLSRLLAGLTADPAAPDHDFYFDGVMYHLYYKPHMIFDILNEINYILKVYGVGDKPIWLNETNAAPSRDPLEPPHFQDLPFEATLSEQAAFIIQIHAVAFAAGVERVQLYKLVNSADHPEDARPFGLLRGDKSRRPAFAAYQTVTTYLAGFQQVALFRQGEVTLVQFTRPETMTTIVWNNAPTPRTANVQARTDRAQLINEAGQVATIQPTNGVYRLELPPAECSGGDCFIGGPPRLLVEADTTGQPPFFTVPATVTPQPTPPPTMWQQATASKRDMAALGFAGLVIAGWLLVAGWLVTGRG